MFRATLVFEAFLVGNQHRRTDVVKGHEWVELGGVGNGRIPRKSSAVPQFSEFDIKARVVVDAETKKGAALGRLGTTQGVSRGELHQFAGPVFDFFPVSCCGDKSIFRTWSCRHRPF